MSTKSSSIELVSPIVSDLNQLDSADSSTRKTDGDSAAEVQRDLAISQPDDHFGLDFMRPSDPVGKMTRPHAPEPADSPIAIESADESGLLFSQSSPNQQMSQTVSPSSDSPPSLPSRPSPPALPSRTNSNPSISSSPLVEKRGVS